VGDSSIPNSSIPSGVYINGNFINKGVSGLKIDYPNGRVIFSQPTSFSPSQISGTYSFPDFNMYYVIDQEINLLFHSSWRAREETTTSLATGRSTNDRIFPAIYMLNSESENNPFQFGGGEEITKYRYKFVVLADDAFNLDGALCIFRDFARKHFSVLNNTSFPYNYYGDYRSGVQYNYDNLVLNNNNYSDLAFISDVKVSKFNEQITSELKFVEYGAIVKLDVEYVRGTRFC
jgi:hypothetical protein